MLGDFFSFQRTESSEQRKQSLSTYKAEVKWLLITKEVKGYVFDWNAELSLN